MRGISVEKERGTLLGHNRTLSIGKSRYRGQIRKTYIYLIINRVKIDQ